MTPPQRLVLTGPTGWIGTACLAGFADRFGPDWTSRVALFGSTARPLRAPDGQVLAVRRLDSIGPADVEGALVLHLAYLTKDKAADLGDDAFTVMNRAIDAHVLRAVEGARPRGVFVASSGAAALAERGADRHPYGLCKLAQEARFLDWGARTGAPVLAGRIYNLAGPHINKLGAYALADFLVQALETGRIRIAAETPVYRSYLHVHDLCDLVIAALEREAAPSRPIDLCGPLVVEMQDVAEAAARATGLETSAIARGPVDFGRPSLYLGDATQTLGLARRLGVRLAPFERQVADTADFIRRAIAQSDDAAPRAPSTAD